MGGYIRITSHLLVLFFILFHFVVSDIPSNQKNTMNNLYNLLQNSTGQSPFPWNSTSDPCSWKGVTCNSDNSSITQLSLQFFSLSTPDFLPVLCQINSLESIDLSNNHLSSIPSGFMTGCGNLSGLRGLNFSRNRLSSSLPSFDGFLKLEYLDLSHNFLVGTISLQMDGLTVDLSDNSLVGSVPENISSSLVRLKLGNNRLKGTIPSSSFRRLPKLICLELHNNNLGGSIPPELGYCKNLALLNLAKNQLTDLLPVELGNLSNLEDLNLEANKLVGKIPIQITQLKVLRKLNISWNYPNGSIPSTISGLLNLSNLDLRGNNLSGSIPESIGNLNFLLELQLGSNELGGKIPLMPQSLKIALNLSSNQFEGQIPKTLSRLTGLEVLDLSNNIFSGKIPDSFSKMESLTQLVLSNNLLVGLIPYFPAYVLIETSGNTGLIEPTKPNPTQKKTNISAYVFIASAGGFRT
ncbi:hypothetical protein Vadar_022770 [Vaccinium darrowii]|uniref:Uncharacterized protein n=1 Tax=Vaccinium darrowii TaxID=229202 RepID=A0ACB7Y1W7_9ERIC|nr:hypothetical protein Vadar_022770 [Vaccinium darrowii]